MTKSVDQARACFEVSKRMNDILIVLGTGSGKSLCYILPALIEKSITIVIVPLKALLQDAILRCSEMGITCIRYDSTLTINDIPDVKIIYCTVEVATSIEFKSFINSLHNIGLLSRLVIDEVHCVSSWSEFRPHFKLLPSLRSVNCPLVLMTATLPPTEENSLKIKFGSDFKVVRGLTVRGNFKYTLERSDHVDDSLLNILKSEKSTNKFFKCIIFCMSKDHVCHVRNFLLRNSFKSLQYVGDMDDIRRSKVLKGRI